ncbi:transposase is4 [Holotrichia oblita]|uniref:Transposase is4 n=1 Tax=Holotrichia oblita TaxID=644536 RepID=A0ACB9SKI7_HOLOL|nr:transposase is4 [Holotrichia oblita]
MSDRTKRILRLALEEKQFYDEDDSSNDPFSDDSDDDPCFLPSDSSDATDSNDSDIVHKQNRVLLVNDNMPGSSQQNASKRPRLVDEVNKEVESEHAEDESQSDVGGEQVVEPIVVEIGNDSQIQLRDLSESVWGPPLGNDLQFNEHFEDTVKPEWRAALGGRQPIDYYQAFVDLSIIDLIVDQTNLYATQFVIENTNVTNNSRVHSWEPTTRTEILHFIGLLGYMGIALMKCEGEDRQLTRPPGTSMRSHVLDKLDCKARENRKYCRGCYKKKMDGVIDKNKVKKVITYCVQCEGNPRYCLECFNYLHKSR